MHLATGIFLITYLLISLGENSPRKLDRPSAALIGAVLMLVTGSVTRTDAVNAMDFSTLAVLFGMMVLLAVLTQSNFGFWLARKALSHCHSQHSLLAFVVFASGIASAIMLNDTVCLLGTPLLLEITGRAKARATPFLLALATSANIGSVMTLTGNPQNIIIGNASQIGWTPFAMRMIPVGIACLFVNLLLLRLLFRKSLSSRLIIEDSVIEIPVERRLALKSAITFVGLIVAFLLGAPMDIASMTAAIVLLVWANRPPREALEAVDWPLLLFFAGLFVVVEGFVKADHQFLDDWFARIGSRVTLGSTVEMSAGSVVGSNLFSNVPFVLIASKWVSTTSNPRFVWLLLALTSTFAGNLTLFGSVANVIVAQGAKDRSPLGFGDFLRAGVPITLATSAVGVLLLWCFFVWKWV